jgi:hypothetical protein
MLSRSQKFLFMDNGTYSPVDPKDILGRKFYHCCDKTSISDENRFNGKTKVKQKYLT